MALSVIRKDFSGFISQVPGGSAFFVRRLRTIMYGVPSNLPLQRFVGVQLNQIALGQYQIQFHFAGAGSISVEGKWELHDSSGVLIDESQEHSTRVSYRIHVIIDKEVTSFRIDAPLSFSLVFSSGHTLKIYDDSPQYESFSIQPGDIFI